LNSGRLHRLRWALAVGAIGPPGSEKSSACMQGFHRNLGDLVYSPSIRNAIGWAYQKWPRPEVVASHDLHGANKRRCWGYGGMKQKMPSDGHEESELASSTVEAGEPDRWDPREGRRQRSERIS